MRFSLHKGAARLTLFFCLALPAHAQGFTEMPDQLFVPQLRPDRSATTVQSPASPPPVVIESHGRLVRVVGTPFLPPLDDAIDFTKPVEISWWTTAEGLLALWLAPAAEEAPTDVASGDGELQLASF